MFPGKESNENIILSERSIDKTSLKKESGKLILTEKRLIFLQKKGFKGKDEIIKDISLNSVTSVLSEKGKKISHLIIRADGVSHRFMVSEKFWEDELNRVRNISLQKQEKILKCPHCSAIRKDDSKFCGECGQKVEEKLDKCPKCSSEIDLGSKFCHECGFTLV